MLDPDTFPTALYVTVDDCCKMHDAPHGRRPGPAAALSPSEVVTLALFAEWGTFRSERAFYRYAQRRLRGAFPRLPARAQFNRQVRAREPLARWVFGVLVGWLVPTSAPYEILDTTAVPTRNGRRHGLGWLPGQADVGKSTRLGWYEGFHLLTAATPGGVLTGFGFGPASTKETRLAETFLTARHDPRVGPTARRPSPPDRRSPTATSPTAASRAASASGAGTRGTAPPSSRRRAARRGRAGPGRCAPGWRRCASGSRACTRSCTTSSA